MKADVFPVVIPPKLDIPSWVPDAIAQSVSAKYAAAVDQAIETALKESGYFEDEADTPREYLDQIIRDDVNRKNVAHLVRDELANIAERYLPLACDPRMEGVWRELSRRSNGNFLSPALHPASAANAKERQEAAMLQLFNVAFGCQQLHVATTTQRQAEQQRNCYLAKAAELEDDALELLLQSSQERYHQLRAAAQAYKDYANEIYAASSATTLERQHDGRGRWVALTIGDTFRTLFGSPMYGLTTVITSVILGRKIELRTVRQWLLSSSKLG